MCPLSVSLRVGLRNAPHGPVLSSGSACCVYGLTFTSHFYWARRTVGYVPFNSETLVTASCFEDIREAVFQLADPDQYDTIVVTNLCVPTASGVPLQLLPREINVCASSASMCRFSACRRTRRPRTCSRARCSPMPARKPSRARSRPARRPQRAPDRDAPGRDVPGRPHGLSACCSSRWGSPRVRSYRCASGRGALCALCRLGGCGYPSLLHRLDRANSRQRAARSSALRRSGSTHGRLVSR